MYRDVGITVAALMLVNETEDVAEFVSRYPRTLTPPESGNVYVNMSSLPKTVERGVVAGINFARKIDVFRFAGMRDEFNIGPRIHPEFHRIFRDFGLILREF
jgi:hypothetical protein